jgi:hypothetical protein
MGVHSTFFGPIKYAILPQHLEKDEVLGGTGLVEAGTYIAILAGTIAGGVIDAKLLLRRRSCDGRGGIRLARRAQHPDAPPPGERDPDRLECVPRVDQADLGHDAYPAPVPGDHARSASSG